MLRRAAVLTATLSTLLVVYGQLWLGWGQSQQQLSAQGDSTLRVANYAFSIWGFIFLGLLVYAIRQALPRTSQTPLLHRLGWPAVVTLVAMSLWVVSSAFDWKAATVVLIFTQLGALLGPMLIHAPSIRALPRNDGDRTMAVWPLGLLVGWLSAAAPLNLAVVLTATGNLPRLLSPQNWAVAVLVAISVGAFAVFARLRTAAYPLAVGWALVAAFVAEQGRNPAAAYTALAGAAVLLISVVTVAVRR